MLTKDSALTAIDSALRPAEDLDCATGIDQQRLLAFLESDLLANVCEPYPVTVQELAVYPDSTKPNEPLEAFCIALRNGRGLFYHPATNRFFGGEIRPSQPMVRNAVRGSPLACWSGSVKRIK